MWLVPGEADVKLGRVVSGQDGKANVSDEAEAETQEKAVE